MTARTIVASAALALVAVGGVAAPAVASTPSQPRCVSTAEYRAVAKGMAVSQVTKATGWHGKITWDYVDEFDHYQDREWKRCGLPRYRGVAVYFHDGIVTGKSKW